MKRFILIVLFFSIFQFNLFSHANSNTNNQIIGTVNSKNLLKSDFTRLFNTQNKVFHKSHLFDLSINHKAFPEVESARKELLAKARLHGFTVSNKEFDYYWKKEVDSTGGIDNLSRELNENQLSVDFARNKLKENILLDKYFKEESKHKIVELMVDELLVIDEANKRNISVLEEEVSKKFNQIVEKEGGIEEFNKFLALNNATADDAKKEIRNKLLYELVRKSIKDDVTVTDNDIQEYYKTHASRYKNIPMEIIKDQVIEDLKEEKHEEVFNSFIKDKKLNADLVIYNKNLFKDKHEPTATWDTVKLQAYNQPSKPLSIRDNTYPTVTKNSIEKIDTLATTVEKEISFLTEPTSPKNTTESNLKPESLATKSLNNLTLQENNSLKKLIFSNIFNKTNKKHITEKSGFPMPTEEQQKELEEAIKLREKVDFEKSSKPINYNTAKSLQESNSKEPISGNLPNNVLPMPGKPLDLDLHKVEKPESVTDIASKPSTQLQIIGHRGDPYKKVENTIESIYSAWEHGADAAEVDLQLTSDDQVILFHDVQLDQNGQSAGFLISASQEENKSISDYTWEELNNAIFNKQNLEAKLTNLAEIPITLDLKSPAMIAKLEDLKIPVNKSLFLELKCLDVNDEYKTKLAHKVTQWINSHGFENQVTVISFDPYCLAKVKRLSPSIKTGLNIAAKASTNKEILANLKNSLEIDYLLSSFQETNEELIKACNSIGLKVIPWAKDESINEEIAEFVRLKDLGITALITNQPGELKTILNTTGQTQNTSNKETTNQDLTNENLKNNANDLDNLNVFKYSSKQLQRGNEGHNLSNDLTELRKKLNQRRLSERSE